MSHELMASYTYEENGENVTYAEPTEEGNPWKGKRIAGFKGPDQIEKAEQWMHFWSEASGDRVKRENLMENADIPMKGQDLKRYLDWSVPTAVKEKKGGALESLKIKTEK